jgi:hypothetical protein
MIVLGSLCSRALYPNCRPRSNRTSATVCRLSESRDGWAAPLTPRGPPPATPRSPMSPGSPHSAGSLSTPEKDGAPAPAPKSAGGGALVTTEDREVGSIGYGVYIAYAKMYGLLFLQLLVCLWASEQTVRVLTNWWLSRWTGAQAVYQAQKSLGEPPFLTFVCKMLSKIQVLSRVVRAR